MYSRLIRATFKKQLSRGLTPPEIAKELSISLRTALYWRDKLGAPKRAYNRRVVANGD
jgi:hypothetical protein